MLREVVIADLGADGESSAFSLASYYIEDIYFVHCSFLWGTSLPPPPYVTLTRLPIIGLPLWPQEWLNSESTKLSQDFATLRGNTWGWKVVGAESFDVFTWRGSSYMWFLEHQHQHLGTCQKYKFLGSAPTLLSQKLWEWPSNLYFNKPFWWLFLMYAKIWDSLL